MALRGGVDILLVPRTRARWSPSCASKRGAMRPLPGAAASGRRLDSALRRVRAPRPPLSIVGGAAHRREAFACSSPAPRGRARRPAAPRRVAYLNRRPGSAADSGAPSLPRWRAPRPGAGRARRQGEEGRGVGGRHFRRPARLLRPHPPRRDGRARLPRPGRRARATAISFGSPSFWTACPRRRRACVYSRADAAQAAAAAHFLERQMNEATSWFTGGSALTARTSPSCWHAHLDVSHRLVGRARRQEHERFLPRRKAHSMVGRDALLRRHRDQRDDHHRRAGDDLREDWGYLQFFIGSAGARILIAFLFIPAFYKYNSTTIYEYLRQRSGRQPVHGHRLFFVAPARLGRAPDGRERRGQRPARLAHRADDHAVYDRQRRVHRVRRHRVGGLTKSCRR